MDLSLAPSCSPHRHSRYLGPPSNVSASNSLAQFQVPLTPQLALPSHLHSNNSPSLCCLLAIVSLIYNCASANLFHNTYNASITTITITRPFSLGNDANNGWDWISSSLSITSLPITSLPVMKIYTNKEQDRKKRENEARICLT
ncbi:phosphoenolpyruvate synthase regulatory protein [Sesbania bispinosa]|nr:phosphoenolpyruvate synthase regulatory protein [Sesbania bispinosa]